MILYNVTIKVDWSINVDWLKWMREIHIPDMLRTGFFSEYRMVKLLMIDESDGPTYAVQYITPSIDQYNRFNETSADSMNENERKKWGDKLVSFGTLMEVVH